ncbi:MAG: TetR family transcriptional regulator [Acidimicrobiia bacterium]
MREPAAGRADEIIDVVCEILDTEGYEAATVRTVARRARVSLTTMYKLFGTVDELILRAVEHWMQTNAYDALTMPEVGEDPYETMVRVLRTMFKPWEEHPRMLDAYHRAQNRPGGERLVIHGMAVVKPIVGASLPTVDAAYLEDLEVIHQLVVRAAIAQFANGEIAVTEILPILERALFRLTTDNSVMFERIRGAVR